jgi:hypothetical protein
MNDQRRAEIAACLAIARAQVTARLCAKRNPLSQRTVAVYEIARIQVKSRHPTTRRPQGKA